MRKKATNYKTASLVDKNVVITSPVSIYSTYDLVQA